MKTKKEAIYTERELIRDLPEDLIDAWERLREFAVTLGEQRIYASHRSIMFSRRACYFFVRPRPNYLEICFFLNEEIDHRLIRKKEPVSRVKLAHTLHVVHRDQVESPITDWLTQAYKFAGK